jgi:hypothetical protein
LRMRLALVASLAALALLVAAGCGGGSKSKQSASSGLSGAEVFPASAPVYIAVNTDLGSDQWKQVDALLKKFPGRTKLFARIQKAMAKKGLDFERDIKPALGPEVDGVSLDFADNVTNMVSVTQPKDEAKFTALIKKLNKIGDPKDTMVTEKIGDWTAIADSQAKLDRLKSAQNGAKLADDDRFKDAVSDLPDETLVTAYVNGQAARQAIRSSMSSNPVAGGFLAGTPLQDLQWISAAATAESNGLRLAAEMKTTKGGKTYSAELVKALPAGAWAYVSFHDLGSWLRRALNAFKSTPGFQAQRTQFEQALGFSLEKEVFPMFSGEGALAVYPGAAGSRIPSIDFVVKISDEAKARRLVRHLAFLTNLGHSGTARQFTVGGVRGTEFAPNEVNFAIDAAVSKGMLLVTNSRSELAAIGGSGKKLADDPLYKEARSSAKAPGDTTFFLYVNLHAALPAIFDLAESGGSSSASLAEARANTKPLQSFFLYGTKDGDVTRLAGFLEIK